MTEEREALIRDVFRQKQRYIMDCCERFGGCSMVATSLPKMSYALPNDP